MLKARERGSTFWGMIVFIVTTLILAVMYYEQASENDALVTKANTANALATSKGADHDAMKLLMLDLPDHTGFVDDTTSYPSAAKIKAALDEYKATLPGIMRLPYDAEKYTATGESGQIEVIGQGEKVITYLPASEVNGINSFESLIPQFTSAAKRMAYDVARAFQQVDDVRTQLAAESKQHDDSIAELQAQIDTLTQQIAQNTATAQGAETDLRDQVASLTSNLESVNAELEQVRTDSEAQITALNNTLNQKTAEVVRLNDRARPFITEGPDGAVLTAGYGTVVVDRGKGDMLMPGTIFTVLGRRKGGSTYAKGNIKVIACDDDTATCRVIEGSAGDPVLGGDLIQSLTYSPKEKLNFAFLGEFKKMGRGDAMERMKSLGANIHEKVRSDTNYLVVGVPGAGVDTLEDTDAYRRAKEFGVKIISETALTSFTRY